jgi:short-subunit dehydrogenase
VADFVKLKGIDEYQSAIGDKLKDVDIGVLIVNAGYGRMGPFDEMLPSEIETSFQTNAAHVVYTIKVLVGQMVKRYENSRTKGAILVTSSGMGSRPISGTITYSASKSFASFLA